MEEQMDIGEKLYKEVASGFPEDVKNAFLKLREVFFVFASEFVDEQDGKLIFNLDGCGSFTRKLILYTPEGTKKLFRRGDSFDFSEAWLIKEENTYKLTFSLGKETANDPFSAEVVFTHAEVEIKIFKSELGLIAESPWQSLEHLASDILMKSELGDAYFNSQERELIPLLKELRAISLFPLDYDKEHGNLDTLRVYAEKYGLTKLLPLIDKAEEEYKTPVWGVTRKRVRLHSMLNKVECEGMWREIYEKIARSQEEYPSMVDTYTKRDMRRLRRKIQKKFIELGYEGEYPVFRKKGAIKWVRVVENYYQSYFIQNKKNVEYIVECSEDITYGELTVNFLCATALLKKGETVRDACACCFNSNGRRLFNGLSVCEAEIPKIDRYIPIAAKRAECRRLNKEEREMVNVVSQSWQDYGLGFLLWGGLFAVGMTLAKILIISLVTVLFDGFAVVPQALSDVPWLILFLLYFFGFGGAMTVVEIISKRK